MSSIKVLVKEIDMAYYDKHYQTHLDELYKERRDAVVRLKNRTAAIMSMATGIELQNIIHKECGMTTEDIAFDKNLNGKPYLNGANGFCFNISHSGNMLVIAYGDEEMGVDVERIKEGNLKVAARCFTKEELAYINGNNSPREEILVHERFTKVWTMKEAYLKYKGIGISVPLNSFCVSPVEKNVKGDNVEFVIKTFGEYVIAICVNIGTQVVFLP